MRKKIIATILCMTTATFGLVACGNSNSTSTKTSDSTVVESSAEATTIAEENTTESSTRESPATEYNSIDEMNEAAGGSRIYCPNDTAENQTFSVIQTSKDSAPIAEYEYTLDGREYLVCFSSDFNASISGLIDGDGYAYDDPSAENFSEFSYMEGDDYYCAHWLTVDGQYIFAALDKTDLDASSFEKIAQTYMDGTIPAEN